MDVTDRSVGLVPKRIPRHRPRGRCLSQVTIWLERSLAQHVGLGAEPAGANLSRREIPMSTVGTSQVVVVLTFGTNVVRCAQSDTARHHAQQRGVSGGPSR
jgi:hypothetical protein